VNPYIGITDFTNIEQVKAMLEVFWEHQKPSFRMLHIGVMMSYKTLNNLETPFSKVFPAKETIADIFASDSNDIYNCLHYADYNAGPDFSADLTRAIGYGGARLHAVQLDMIWPEPDQIAKAVDASGKKIEVILQIGKRAFEEVNDNPRAMVDKLRIYDGIIHRVLLDRSMGRGIGMDARLLLPFAYLIRERFPKIGMGAAGGLGPKTMHLIEPLSRKIPDISADAQGQVRPSGSALDPVDWKMAADYLISGLSLLL
jgi:hypothetical protein